jgi:drug/metabolite transporter (DMT)-like permease
MLVRKKVVNVGKGELKIMALIIYYLVLGVIGLAVFGTSNNLSKLKALLICEATGERDCIFETPIQHILSIVVNILLALFPVATILASCDPKAIKMRFKSKRTLSSKGSVSTRSLRYNTSVKSKNTAV